MICIKILRGSLLLLCQLCEYQLRDFDHGSNSALNTWHTEGANSPAPPTTTKKTLNE